MLHNNSSSEENKKAAQAGLDEVQNMLDAAGGGQTPVELKNPNKEFENIADENSFIAKLAEELAWKKQLLDDFKGNPKLLNPAEIKLPLWLDPETDDVQVYLDGKFWGTVKLGMPREQNILRYSAVGSHRLEFKRPGYKSAALNTGDLQTPFYRPKLEREPCVTLDLAGELGNQKFSGEAVLEDGAFLVGTSEGSLLRVVNTQGKAAARRYDLPGGGGVNREVYGAPLALKRADKSGLIVYCTKAGDCLGLAASETGLKEAWPPIKGDPLNLLTAPPAAGKLSLLGNHPFCLLPLGKKLAVIDAETGLSARTLELKQTITAAPLVLEQNLIVAGCADGRPCTASIWRMKSRGNGIATPRPPPFAANRCSSRTCCSPARKTAGFTSSTRKKDGFRIGDVALEGALASEPLVLKRRLYAGSIQRENFYCVDLVTRSELWRIKETGGVAHSPATLGKRVYFVTQDGPLIRSGRGKRRAALGVSVGSRETLHLQAAGLRAGGLCAHRQRENYRLR